MSMNPERGDSGKVSALQRVRALNKVMLATSKMMSKFKKSRQEFNVESLRALRERFMDLASTNLGHPTELTRKQFVALMHAEYPFLRTLNQRDSDNDGDGSDSSDGDDRVAPGDDEDVVQHLFAAFDADRSGTISFKVRGLAVCVRERAVAGCTSSVKRWERAGGGATPLGSLFPAVCDVLTPVVLGLVCRVALQGTSPYGQGSIYNQYAQPVVVSPHFPATSLARGCPTELTLGLSKHMSGDFNTKLALLFEAFSSERDPTMEGAREISVRDLQQLVKENNEEFTDVAQFAEDVRSRAVQCA